MIAPAEPLTFHTVDGLAFAAAAGRLEAAKPTGMYAPASLGPLIEFFQLAAAGRLPGFVCDWLAKNGAASMCAALRDAREHWVGSDRRRMGFMRARKGPEGDERFTAFLMDAQRAARDVALFPGSTPGQLVAAIEELEANIHEHSQSPETGLLAFRAAPGVFEFVVADQGIGILNSLRTCAANAALQDHGKALEAALAEGTSRFGNNIGRGLGFRPIFLGLVNLQGSLRFRTGDHALLMDGTSPTLSTAQLAQKPTIDGFFASVRSEAVTGTARG